MPIVQTSLDDINIILGHAHSTAITMDDADVRDLAGVEEGEISINDLTGKPKYSFEKTYNPKAYWLIYDWLGTTTGLLIIYFGNVECYNDEIPDTDATSIVIGSYTYLRGGLMEYHDLGEAGEEKWYSVSRYLT